MKPSHLGPDGAPRMVDVGRKPITARRAVAAATVRMRPETLASLLDGGGQGDGVGVVDLPDPQCLAGGNELVAGGEDGDTRPPANGDLPHPE